MLKQLGELKERHLSEDAYKHETLFCARSSVLKGVGTSRQRSRCYILHKKIYKPHVSVDHKG